jgi:hypothetical protein
MSVVEENASTIDTQNIAIPYSFRSVHSSLFTEQPQQEVPLISF